MGNEQRRTHGQERILKIIKRIGARVGRGLGKAGLAGGHFTQVGSTHGDGPCAAGRKSAHGRVAAYGVPLFLRPADVVVFKSTRAVENGGGVAPAYRGFGHFPWAKIDAHEAGYLDALLRRGEQFLVLSGAGGVAIQILRKTAQVLHRAHPGGQTGFVRLVGLTSAAGLQQQQTQKPKQQPGQPGQTWGRTAIDARKAPPKMTHVLPPYLAEKT